MDRQYGTERIGFDLGSTSTRRERAASVLGIIDLMVVSSVFGPPSVIKFPEVKSIALQKICCTLREFLSSRLTIV